MIICFLGGLRKSETKKLVGIKEVNLKKPKISNDIIIMSRDGKDLLLNMENAKNKSNCSPTAIRLRCICSDYPRWCHCKIKGLENKKQGAMDIVKAMCDFDLDHTHGIRIGTAVQLYSSGLDCARIVHFLRWRTTEMLFYYIRQIEQIRVIRKWNWLEPNFYQGNSRNI